MAKKTSKNVWIIPPGNKDHITLSEASEGDKVTKESETQLTNEQFQALGFNEAACLSVFQCPTVSVTECDKVTIKNCLSLIGCRNVSITCTGVVETG